MKRKLVAVAGSLVLLAGSGSAALAEPGGTSQEASCMAVLTWLNTHHPDFTGGLDRVDVAELTKRVSEELGIPPGDIYSVLARLSVRGNACLA
jgi:hypothetical protein